MPAKKKIVETQEAEISDKVAAEPKKKRTYVRKPKKVAEAVAGEAIVEAPVKKRRAPKKTLVSTEVPVIVAEHEVSREAVYLDGTPHISVVIPAYNEAERIAPTLVEAHAYFTSLGVSYEVLVVDDGSSDRTAEIVERMGSDFKELVLIRMPKNGGKGAAVARGMLEARGAIRLFVDADGATPFSEFAKLEEAIKGGADIAFASRALKDSVLEPPQGVSRRVLGKMGNMVIQATNLPGVHDSQCGFKAYTAAAAEAVFPHLTQHRWGFDIEALVIAKRLGLTSKEVAITWRDQAGSTVGSAAHLQTLWEDLRIRYNAITGAYPKR